VAQRPSGDETNRRHQDVLLHASDAVLQDVRRAARHDDWRVMVLQQLHRSQPKVMRAGIF